MILETLKLKDKLKLEIVDGEDICLSYKNNKLVNSCMNRYGAWRFTNLYKYVKDLKLLRMMNGDDLVLRALLWTVRDEENQKFTYVDRVYKDGLQLTRDRNGLLCFNGYERVAHPTAYEQFKNVWPKFADVRNTAKRIFAELRPNRVKIWPYMDTFTYVNTDTKMLSNDYKYDYDLDTDDGFVEYTDIFTDALSHVENY
jgi:hypothetical protein